MSTTSRAHRRISARHAAEARDRPRTSVASIPKPLATSVLNAGSGRRAVPPRRGVARDQAAADLSAVGRVWYASGSQR
jgi:hypothetical protein